MSGRSLEFECANRIVPVPHIMFNALQAGATPLISIDISGAIAMLSSTQTVIAVILQQPQLFPWFCMPSLTQHAHLEFAEESAPLPAESVSMNNRIVKLRSVVRLLVASTYVLVSMAVTILSHMLMLALVQISTLLNMWCVVIMVFFFASNLLKAYLTQGRSSTFWTVYYIVRVNLLCILVTDCSAGHPSSF